MQTMHAKQPKQATYKTHNSTNKRNAGGKETYTIPKAGRQAPYTIPNTKYKPQCRHAGNIDNTKGRQACNIHIQNA